MRQSNSRRFFDRMQPWLAAIATVELDVVDLDTTAYHFAVEVVECCQMQGQELVALW